MEKYTEEMVLDALLNFQIPTIEEETRFWMIRTQKGYFYEEFLKKRFVALAWNNIDQHTDFAQEAVERLKDDIVMRFPEIKRPSTVISKCNNFINEIRVGDILVIPSRGSKYVTFAKAGEYYEDEAKSVDLEKTVIFRIKNNDVDINDVSCPYKKRRNITLLRTIKNEDVNYSLYKAISNYHGISNLDSYSNQILNYLYNFYSFKGDIVLVYSIRKKSKVKPRELSSLIYGNTECLARIIPEDHISTQMSLHSPGDVVYILEKALEFVRNGWVAFFGIVVFLGGGSILSFKVNGLIDIIKSIINAPEEIKQKKADTELKKLDILNKKLELNQKLQAAGISLVELENSLEMIATSAKSLQAEPIVLNDNLPTITLDDEASELGDTDEE